MNHLSVSILWEINTTESSSVLDYYEAFAFTLDFQSYTNTHWITIL